MCCCDIFFSCLSWSNWLTKQNTAFTLKYIYVYIHLYIAKSCYILCEISWYDSTCWIQTYLMMFVPWWLLFSMTWTWQKNVLIKWTAWMFYLFSGVHILRQTHSYWLTDLLHKSIKVSEISHVCLIVNESTTVLFTLMTLHFVSSHSYYIIFAFSCEHTTYFCSFFMENVWPVNILLIFSRDCF